MVSQTANLNELGVARLDFIDDYDVAPYTAPTRNVITEYFAEVLFHHEYQRVPGRQEASFKHTGEPPAQFRDGRLAVRREFHPQTSAFGTSPNEVQQAADVFVGGGQ